VVAEPGTSGGRKFLGRMTAPGAADMATETVTTNLEAEKLSLRPRNQQIHPLRLSDCRDSVAAGPRNIVIEDCEVDSGGRGEGESNDRGVYDFIIRGACLFQMMKS